MWAGTRPAFLLTPLYFIAIVAVQVAMHAGGVITANICPQLPPITLFSTPAEIQQCYGGSDIASYVRGAFALQEHGLEAFGSMGFATWPPGFSFLELMLIKLAVVPLPLALFVLGSMLWSIVFFQLHALLRQVAGIASALAAAVPLLLLAVPFMSDFYLWRGMLMSEPTSTALFTIAALDIWRQVAAKSRITPLRAIFLGMLMAIAVYLRAQFDLIFHALVLLSLLLTFACAFMPRAGKVLDKTYLLKSLAPSLLIVFVAFQALVVPYKAYLAAKGHGMAMANVTYIFESLWKSESWHIANGTGFFSDGGGHSMCAVAPAKCQEFEQRRLKGEKIPIAEYKKAAFRVALTRPFSLLSFKWPYFWKAWKNEGPNSVQSGRLNVMLFLAMFATAIGRSLQNRKQGLLEMAAFLAFVAGATVFSFLVHFEPRYLYPVKLFVMLWTLMFISSLVSRNSRLKLHPY